jgi:hypothetical protein
MSGRKTNVSPALAAVATASEAFESRWTMRALKRVDPALYSLFAEQEADYGRALLSGTEAEVEEQAGAMVRGYAAIAKRMVEANEPDDAYLLGIDPVSGTRVAIGDQKHAAARVRELEPVGEVIFITPDEVACIVAGLEAIKRAKNIFPDCEVISLRPNEAAKGDSIAAE